LDLSRHILLHIETQAKKDSHLLVQSDCLLSSGITVKNFPAQHTLLYNNAPPVIIASQGTSALHRACF
jgi:hypothetical protein